MKKSSKMGYALLAIAFALVSIVAFVVPTEKTSVFWVAYAFTVIAFALQIFVWKKTIGSSETLKSKFLGFPIIHIGFVYLLVQVIAFAVFIATATFLPDWVPIVVCVLILGISAICLITTEIGKDEVVRVEQKVQKKVSAMKVLQVDVEMLASSEKDPETKKAFTKLAEKIRYSDPMSDDALIELEGRIEEQIQLLKNSVNKLEAIENIESLVDERNAKCKILK